MTSATSLTNVKRRMPIARRLSVPSDPAKPSFLTLPSEIRNAVYDIIFLVEAPIHLTLSGSYGAQGMFQNHLFREVLVSGFAILFICRQVYHEAATRMMAGNKWIIYKGLCEPSHNSCFNGQVRQLAVAAVWLKKLGSRTTMLTKIAIDLDGNCPLEFAAQIPYGWRSLSPLKNLEGAIPVWNLLRMLKQNPSLDIDFVHPKEKTYSELHFSWGHETGLVPEHLATVVRTLLRDTLKLTQYGSQVWGVYIQRDCLDGCIIFRGSSSCLEAWPRRDFQFSGDRSTLSWVQPTKLSLLELPSTLQTRIFRQIDRTCNQWNNDRSDQSAWVTWDLNKKTMVGASPVLSSVCRSLRLNYDIGYGFWRYNHHRVRISSFLPSLDLICNLILDYFWRFFQYCAKPRRIKEVNMYTYNKGPAPPSGFCLVRSSTSTLGHTQPWTPSGSI
jgi:hypothetical protein